MKNNKEVKLVKKDKKEVPIFFATDDNYIPYLDVAIRSLIANASKNYRYTINILNTGIKPENIEIVKRNEQENVTINFRDITEDIKPIKNKLKGLYHFSAEMYYRLFIENIFPQYDKVLYLDCDIVVVGDISKLYNTNMEDKWIAGVTERIIYNDEVFSKYVKVTTGVDPINYINSGILVMNLKKLREVNLAEQFMYVLSKYNVDVIDPDQAYINFLCRDNIKYLPNGWNKEPLPEPAEGGLNIVHYALYKKPWQYDDIINVEYFWQYAKKSPFYAEIKNRKDSFSDEQKAKKEQANIEIVEHAKRVIASNNTFKKVLLDNGNILEGLIFTNEGVYEKGTNKKVN